MPTRTHAKWRLVGARKAALRAAGMPSNKATRPVMEVTCDRCQAEYEFEETLVSEGGTTVKCTNCGHLFKVHKRKGEPPSEGPDTAHTPARWTLRTPDGEERSLNSLEELTKLIIAGDLSRDDRLSHTGKAWRRLGDIAELETFFQQSGRGSLPPPPRASDRPLPPPAPIAPGQGPFLSAPGRASQPAMAPDMSSPRFERLGVPVPLEEPESERALPPAPRAMARERTHTGEGHTTPLPQPLVTLPTAGPRDGLADELSDLHLGRRRGPGSTLVVMILAVALLVTGVWFLTLPPTPTPPPRDADAGPSRFIERAERALAQHDPDHFQQAATDFTKALAFQEHDPYLLSALSRVYARWSQQLRLQADLLERLHDTSRVDQLRREARQLGERARATAETAARKNPGNDDAEVALSDALRLSGDLVAARAELDRARATQPTPDGETLRVAAWLSMAEAKGEPSAGRKWAEQAVAQEPESLSFRILLTYLLLSLGDREAAAYHLGVLRKQAPAHPIVELLSQLSQQTVADVDAGVRADAEAHDKPVQDSEQNGQEHSQLASDGQPVRATEPPPDRHALALEVARLCRLGENLLEEGDPDAARRAFEDALSIAPEGSRATTGLGFVYLEDGQVKKAHALFLRASRAGYAEAFIGLGASLRRLNRNDGALAAYRTYMRRFPRGRSVSIASRQVQLLEEALKTTPESTPIPDQAP